MLSGKDAVFCNPGGHMVSGIEWILSMHFKDDSNFVRMKGREILRK